MHWRRASIAAAFVLATATLAVYLNRHTNGDVYWLLAARRYTAHHGVASRDPFLTLSHGREWFDQQCSRASRSTARSLPADARCCRSSTGS